MIKLSLEILIPCPQRVTGLAQWWRPRRAPLLPSRSLSSTCGSTRTCTRRGSSTPPRPSNSRSRGISSRRPPPSCSPLRYLPSWVFVFSFCQGGHSLFAHHAYALLHRFIFSFLVYDYFYFHQEDRSLFAHHEDSRLYFFFLFFSARWPPPSRLPQRFSVWVSISFFAKEVATFLFTTQIAFVSLYFFFYSLSSRKPPPSWLHAYTLLCLCERCIFLFCLSFYFAARGGFLITQIPTDAFF